MKKTCTFRLSWILFCIVIYPLFRLRVLNVFRGCIGNFSLDFSSHGACNEKHYKKTAQGNESQEEPDRAERELMGEHAVCP